MSNLIAFPEQPSGLERDLRAFILESGATANTVDAIMEEALRIHHKVRNCPKVTYHVDPAIGLTVAQAAAVDSAFKSFAAEFREVADKALWTAEGVIIAHLIEIHESGLRD